MVLSEYKLDIIRNLITRAPIIIMLIIVLFLVLTIGLYIELHRTKELMKINNELLRDIKYQNLNRKNEE